MQTPYLSKISLALCTMGLCSLAYAADVPPGTQLAKVQHLVRDNSSDPASMDPQLAESSEAFTILKDSFAGLVSIDNQGQVQPELALSWESKDNKTWIFHLRPGIKWSNGQPITAKDVVYTWRRLADPKTASPYQSFISAFHLQNSAEVISGKLPTSALGIKALDDKTVQVNLSVPLAWFLKGLGVPSLFPVNQQVIEKYGEKWTQPQNIVVSGAYKPTKWIINERFVSERNPNYWNDKATVIDQVTYLPLTEPKNAFNRYQTGEIDISAIPVLDYPRIKKMIPNEVKVNPILGVYYYWFNTTKPPFNDQRVRMALNLAVDKSVITDKVIGLGQKPAWTLMPLTIGGETYQAPEIASWSYEKRVEEAKKLLAEAGFSAEKPLKVDLLYNTSQDNLRIAIAVTSMWKKALGVQTTLDNQEWKTLLETKHNGNFEVVRSSWLADYDTPPTFLMNYLTGDSLNNARYSNPKYDQWVKLAVSEADPIKAKEDYQQAMDVLSHDVPALPLYYYTQTKLVKPWVGGMKPDNLGFAKTQDMYITQH